MTLFGAEVVGVAPSGGQPCKMELGFENGSRFGQVLARLDKFGQVWTGLNKLKKSGVFIVRFQFEWMNVSKSVASNS